MAEPIALTAPRRALACSLGLALSLTSLAARADLGDELRRLESAFTGQLKTERPRFRLMERGDVTPIVLPPWSLDDARGDCTTLALLAPPPTQFVVHVHPWANLPSTFASSAGAFQVTRCGRERLSLMQVVVEMRSPRAVVHPLVAVGAVAPPALSKILPERDAGGAAALGDPGPVPEREPLAERLRRFEEAATNRGASGVERASIPRDGSAHLRLAPGCHRLLVTGTDGAPGAVVLLAQGDDEPERLELPENGESEREICTARDRPVTLSLEPAAAEKSLVAAHFALPAGLPGRFGPELAERLVQALGGSAAPRKLGTLVAASLGAQGRTPLPRALLPQTCYVAAVAVVHGAAQAISLGVQSGARSGEATASAREPGTHLGFCTGKIGQVELDVEASGLGLAWLFTLFQMGPARPGAP